LNLTVNHPARALKDLASQIALPHEHAPVRFPSFPALERTATMAFNTPAALNLSAGATAKGMLTRQAAYPAWFDQAIGSAWIVDYTVTQITTGSTQTNSDYIPANNFKGWSIGARSANATTVGFFDPSANGGVRAPWGYPILGADSETGPQPWLYVPAGWYLTAVIGTTTTFGTNSAWSLEIEQWNNPGEAVSLPYATNINLETTIAANSLSGATPSVPLSPITGTWIRPTIIRSTSAAAGRSGGNLYYSLMVATGAVTFVPTTSDQGTFNSVTVPAVTALLPLNSLTEFPNSTIPWSSTRLTASSLLATNVTNVLSKGGTILAARVDPKQYNPWTVTQVILAAKHPSEKAYLAMETGMYTYCPPSTDLANFYDYTGNTASAVPLPMYRLDNDAMVNVFYFNAPAATTASFAVNIDWHIEFRSSSTLFELGISTVTLETLHQAQLSLVQVGFFFENFDHKAILRSVLSAAKWAAPHLANMINPELGRVVGNLLKPSSGPSQPQSTSLSNSIQAPRGQEPSGRKKRKGKRNKQSYPVYGPPNRPPPQSSKQRQLPVFGPPTRPGPPGPPKRKGGLDMYLASRKH
jgi:hypothetical protein